MERIIKTVLISVPSIKGFRRWVLRVVECQLGQNGYRSERGVRVIWESDYLYRPHARSPRSQGWQAKQQAKQIEEQARAEVLGLTTA